MSVRQQPKAKVRAKVTVRKVRPSAGFFCSDCLESEFDDAARIERLARTHNCR